MKEKVKEIISYISQELLSHDSMPVIEKKVIHELQEKGYDYYEISEALTFIIKFIEKTKTEKKYDESVRVFSAEENLKMTAEAGGWLRKIYEYKSISFSEFEDILAFVSSGEKVYDKHEMKILVRAVLKDNDTIPEDYILN